MIQQPNLDLLKMFWKNQLLKEYILKQIREADLELYKITSKYVCLLYSVKTNIEEQLLKFIITLGKGYPGTPPQVHIASMLTAIPLKSYKDYLRDIIEDEWNATLNLKYVVDKIGGFIGRLQTQKNDFASLQTLGKYQINRFYIYSVLKSLSQTGPYIAFQTTEDQVFLYVISLTSTHFILFKPITQPYFQENKLIVPKQTEIDSMRISFIGEIQGLLEIVHSREQKNEYTLKFDGQDSKNKSIAVWKKKLKITKSTQLIENIIKCFKKFKGVIQLTSGFAQYQSEQQKLIRQVKFNEHRVKHQFNRQTVSNLNDSYQKLVQFYSSLGLPYDEVYLRKIGLLFAREDVQLIMWDQLNKRQ